MQRLYILRKSKKPSQPDNFEAIDPNEVSQTIDKINQALKGKDIDKKVKQKLNYTKKNWPKNKSQFSKAQGKGKTKTPKSRRYRSKKTKILGC